VNDDQNELRVLQGLRRTPSEPAGPINDEYVRVEILVDGVKYTKVTLLSDTSKPFTWETAANTMKHLLRDMWEKGVMPGKGTYRQQGKD
jgi:hypothetical protein